MSFNEKLSYTEHVVVSPTTDFAIGFADYGLPSDTINVFVDDVLATEAGYTVTRKNNMVVELQPAVASGVVRLQRATNLDASFYRFTAGAKFVAANIDANFNQILHSQQETRDGFNKLAGDVYPLVNGLEEALDKADSASQAAQEAADAAEEAAQTTRMASQVIDASGATQQQVNYNGGSKWHLRTGGYKLHERVVLTNGDIVKSTMDGNTNNPNSDMTGWVDACGVAKNLKSVSELTTVNIGVYKSAFVDAYYENGDQRGGGYFYYDANDTTSSVDNIFVFASSSSGRWKRKLDGTSINTAQAGILNDGSDQGVKIQALFDAAVNASMMYGYTWKITIDGLEQRTWSSIPLSCNLTLLKLKDIWINFTIPDQLSISMNGVAVNFIGTDAWVANKPDTWRRKSRSKALDNVTINGLSKSNTVGVLFSPHVEGNFANYVFDGLSINGFKYDLVLSSNCYLITFENCSFTGATERIFTYASNIGLASSMQNMGENIRFNSCIFANSRNILDLNYESWITFNACSFDYCGQAADLEGWFKLTASVGLNFFGCHFEAGNEGAQLGRYMFYATSTFATVNIFGGAFVFSSVLTNNDYVFYSTTQLNGEFQVDGLWCFGVNIAKKGWSNTKMGRFKIYTNTGVGLENVNASGLQAINKSITRDAKFAKSVLLNTPYDFWFVNGLDTSSTNQLVSANVASSFGVNNDGTGTSYKSLKVTPTATEQTLYCLIKRKDGVRSNMSPVIRLSHFASREVGLFIRLLPVDVKFTRNAQGVEIPTLNDTRWVDSTLGYFVKATVGTNKSETSVYAPSTRSYENIDSFEYFLLQINFSSNSGFDYVVTGLECYEVDV